MPTNRGRHPQLPQSYTVIDFKDLYAHPGEPVAFRLKDIVSFLGRDRDTMGQAASKAGVAYLDPQDARQVVVKWDDLPVLVKWPSRKGKGAPKPSR